MSDDQILAQLIEPLNAQNEELVQTGGVIKLILSKPELYENEVILDGLEELFVNNNGRPS